MLDMSRDGIWNNYGLLIWANDPHIPESPDDFFLATSLHSRESAPDDQSLWPQLILDLEPL